MNLLGLLGLENGKNLSILDRKDRRYVFVRMELGCKRSKIEEKECMEMYGL